MRSSDGARKGFADTVIIVTSVFISGARALGRKCEKKKLLFKLLLYRHRTYYNILYNDVAAVCPAAGARSTYIHDTSRGKKLHTHNVKNNINTILQYESRRYTGGSHT